MGHINPATSLKIYEELHTPFLTVAVQRNLGAYGLKQMVYGSYAGVLDRQCAAQSFIRLEARARKENTPRNIAHLMLFINQVLAILIKDGSQGNDLRTASDLVQITGILTVMNGLAAQNYTIPPQASDFGLVKADFVYPSFTAVATGPKGTIVGQPGTLLGVPEGGEGSFTAGPSGAQGLGQGQGLKRPTDSNEGDDAAKKKFITSSGAATKPSAVSASGDNMDINTDDYMDVDIDSFSVFGWFNRAFGST